MGKGERVMGVGRVLEGVRVEKKEGWGKEQGKGWGKGQGKD